MERNTVPTWKVLVGLGIAAIPACSPREPESEKPPACTQEYSKAFYALVQSFSDRLQIAQSQNGCSIARTDVIISGQCTTSQSNRYDQSLITMDGEKMTATYNQIETWRGNVRESQRVVANDEVTVENTGTLNAHARTLTGQCTVTPDEIAKMKGAIERALEPFQQ